MSDSVVTNTKWQCNRYAINRQRWLINQINSTSPVVPGPRKIESWSKN